MQIADTLSPDYYNAFRPPKDLCICACAQVAQATFLDRMMAGEWGPSVPSHHVKRDIRCAPKACTLVGQAL